MATTLAIRVPPESRRLPDTDKTQNNYEIKSASSNRLYRIGQNKVSDKWFCTCPSWCTRRYCKHLLKGCLLTPSQIEGYGQITSGPGARGRLRTK